MRRVMLLIGEVVFWLLILLSGACLPLLTLLPAIYFDKLIGIPISALLVSLYLCFMVFLVDEEGL